jgi:cytochrome P450
VVGRWCAGLALSAARRKREALARSIMGCMASLHVDAIRRERPQSTTFEVADMCIGLLTAASKNVAIGSATCLVYLLQHAQHARCDTRAAVSETVRLTCLSFGALREACRERLNARTAETLFLGCRGGIERR